MSNLLLLDGPAGDNATAPADRPTDALAWFRQRGYLFLADQGNAAPGVGLAAIQVGVPKRVVVMDLSREGEEKALAHGQYELRLRGWRRS